MCEPRHFRGRADFVRVPLLCPRRHHALVHADLGQSPRTPLMPGIRFGEARAKVTMAEVLGLIGFVPYETSGDQVRGPCPIHRSTTGSSRSFSANTRSNICKCFKCGASGNHLDLYAAVTRLSLFAATVELCEQLQREVPWMLDGDHPGPR
ncbi:CHC2 zinc finger domain-containing protein [Singulisphaera sp. Ch08]|uniref:CHC2 zinc finger domain-containing protein n=1 Tax=Singulisphaera sp. Ch08 TaxID=3120278 RepID=UPI0038737732